MASRLTVSSLNLDERRPFVRLMHSFEWSSVFHKANRPITWLFSLQITRSPQRLGQRHIRSQGYTCCAPKALKTWEGFGHDLHGNATDLLHNGLQHVTALRPSQE